MGDTDVMRPMLATRGTRVPTGAEWLHEVKWDGMRVLASVRQGRLTLTVPGTAVGVEPALEAVRRLAKAVGAPSSRFTAAITVDSIS